MRRTLFVTTAGASSGATLTVLYYGDVGRMYEKGRMPSSE